MPRASRSARRVPVSRTRKAAEPIKILWYGPRGSRKASTAKSFTVTPPGARSSIHLEIPAASRRSIKGREKYVLDVLAVYAAEVAKRKRAAARLKKKREEEGRLEALALARKKRAAAKKRSEKASSKSQEREVREEIESERKPLPQKIKKKLAKKKLPEDLLQSQVLAHAGIREVFPEVPKLSELAARHPSKTWQEEKQVIGTPPRKKREDSLESKLNYNQKKIDLIKLNVDFNEGKEIHVFSHSSEATALTLREYFKPMARKFVDEMRGTTEEAYILRVKTKAFLPGIEKGRDEGIGLPRTRIWRSLPASQAVQLRLNYPGLSDADILVAMQHRQVDSMMDKLFEYFVERYSTYLGKKVIEGIAITGFGMECVEKIVEETVSR